MNLPKFAVAIFAVLSVPSTAQIIVQPFQAEITCDIDALADLPTISATSSSGKVSISYEENIFSGGCLGTLVRTFNYSDPAGNKAQAQQIVHISDKLPPRLLGEAPNITTTRDMIPQPALFGVIDNSGESFDVIFSEVNDEKSITRSWMCTDSCGNTSRHSQIITLE
jgi:hypothetical protein